MSRTSALRIEQPLSVEEYLAFERAADNKHEYDDGEIIAFAGASRQHNLVGGNTFRHLGNQLEGRPCEVYMTEMLVRIATTKYVYPDVVVVCDEPEFADEEFDILLNPTVIIEVLSPTTESRDRGDKLQYYGALESVKDYLLVAQDRIRVDHYVKQSPSEWNLRVYTEAGDKIEIASIGCKLSVAAVYARVNFPPRRLLCPQLKSFNAGLHLTAN